MKKTIINLVALVIAISLSSAVMAETKIGYVNFGKLMEESKQSAVVRKALETEFSGRDKGLGTSRDSIMEMEEKLKNDGSIMSESNRVNLEREILSQKRDFKRQSDEYREDFNIRRNEEVASLQKSIYEVIKQFSEKMEFDLVLTQPVLYASPAIDITDKVLVELNTAK